MIETSVLVVGAGLSGLSTAVYLGLHGVPPLLVERHATTSQQPKARGQFPHVLEALKVAGLDQAVVAAGGTEQFRIVIAASMHGPVYREITPEIPDFSALSPAGWANASQEQVEPILAARARELGADLRFGTELVSFEQDADGVLAVLRSPGGTVEVRAQYLVAADGHRSPIRTALGIGCTGRGVLGESLGVLFTADLPGLDGLYYLQNPALPGGSGVLVSTDVPGRFALGVAAGDSEPDWPELIRVATGLPDLVPGSIEAGGTKSTTEHRVADRFSLGRVHLVGDAARVMPPTGAFGGNTAIMDGYSLAWKLALVVRGQAGPGLLDSHDVERRPYSMILADQQYAAFLQRLRPGAPAEVDPIEPVSTLFFGYRQLGAAVLENGDDRSVLENPERPTARPGSRAPHVVLPDGRSTVDLFGRGFVVLTCGAEWVASAGVAADRLGIPLVAHQVDGSWPEVYGVSEDGAVLVRPDGYVAWRSVGAGSAADLEEALRVVLSRP
ncbi:FAD-dependent monooxygenase [Kutzneria albida]|uniref:FAD-binding domain-containing protein n=1 Tax=Kutzneria albida DSM 43870 TaxID=1449976 RepID=W5WGM2_9PSEU|nr:FAD-dependent monooxygenase [Kutzneria albida]AHH99726.1 hypothetical protein KALB_6366 [Kutzneria albida DSM 43870]